MCFLLPAVPCLFIFGLFEAIIVVQWLSKVYIVQDEIMELICAPEVMDGGIFLYCQTVRSAGLLGAKL
jgi:NhaP-type Na+/H+ or K+/H+ antiporter